MSDEEYAKIQIVDWEMLPAGSEDRVLAQLAKRRGASAERMHVASERLRTLERLGRDGFIVGTRRFSNYFGASLANVSSPSKTLNTEMLSMYSRQIGKP